MNSRSILIGRSRRLAMLLLLLHSIAAVVVSATDMPTLAKAAVFTLILFSLSYYLARDAWQHFRGSWIRVFLDGEGVLVTTRDGRILSGQIKNYSVVCPYFVMLCSALDGNRLPASRVIFPDALDDGEFRELCVFLKFYRCNS